MAWIEPLKLETWFVQVFAGDGRFFGIIALIALSSMAGYFRMNGVSLAFMAGVFLLMFSGVVPPSLIVLLSIIGGLLIGFWVSRLVK